MDIPNFVQLERLTLEEFVNRVTSTAKIKLTKTGLERLNISTRKRHWIHLIETDNLICPVTGKKVSYCSYDRMDYRKKSLLPTFHYNFYSEDNELFSIDHKIPISKGGHKRAVENIQPMLIIANFNKGADLIYT